MTTYSTTKTEGHLQCREGPSGALLSILHARQMTYYKAYRKGEIDLKMYLQRMAPVDRAIDRVELSAFFREISTQLSQREEKK